MIQLELSKVLSPGDKLDLSALGRRLRLAFACVSVTFFATFASSVNAQVPGDFDLDGKADFTVAGIDQNAKTTTILSRSSSGVANVSYLFKAAAYAIVTGRWYSDLRTFPGIVYTVTGLPLQWAIKNPAGGENNFSFGLPGDTVPNTAYDLDGDGIADPVVVRNGVPGYYEGFKIWYVAQSAAGGAVQETVFGIAADKPFIGQDPNGMGRLYVLRDGFTWIGRSFKGGDVSTVQWGVTGDIPLAPQVIAGLLAHIVVRPYATGQAAFIRYENGVVQTIQMGGVNTTPVVGNFFGLGNELGWFDRRMGTASVRLPTGTAITFPFGASGQLVVAPNGQITEDTAPVVPATPGTSGDFGECENVVSIGKLPGILYKPINEHGGRGPTIIAQARGRRIGKTRLEIRDVNCKPIGALGLFSNQGPWGERFYAKSGKGSKHTHTQLQELAKRAGSTNILIEGKGMWILIKDPTDREGRL